MAVLTEQNGDVRIHTFHKPHHHLPFIQSACPTQVSIFRSIHFDALNSLPSYNAETRPSKQGVIFLTHILSIFSRILNKKDQTVQGGSRRINT
jgi:hypothetical protein